MPKRKRGAENDPVRLRKAEVEQKLELCKKELNKALKLAKHSEILKLGRRQKQATEDSDEANLKRLNREFAVLKTLDFAQATDAHLHKTLLKSKSIAESPLLPDKARAPPRRGGGDEEQILAFNNVTARLYNAKSVKTTMSQIMTKMYIALEIPEPSNRGKGKKLKADVKGNGKEQKNSDITDEDTNNQGDEDQVDTVPELEEDTEWEGFSSGSEAEVDDGNEEGVSEDDGDGDDFSLDEEQLSRYDAFLGNSSDESDSDNARESSFPPQSIPTTHSSKPTSPLSISRSPSPPPAKPKSILKPTKSKPELEAPKGSVFLPTLMGGYWSGTESEASDIEELIGPQPRKNRRGQRERRKIAELKFGTRAKHLAAEDAGKSSRNGRDDRAKDWDMQRGAIGDDDRNPRNRKERRINGVKRGRDNRQMTGENALPLGGRGPVDGEPKKEKDDGKKGVNHPSWQAAKKAKEAQKTVAFQGTKVKFT